MALANKPLIDQYVNQWLAGTLRTRYPQTWPQTAVGDRR